MGAPENKTPARDGARTGADFKMRDGLAHPEYSDRPWIIPPGATNADVRSKRYGIMTRGAIDRFQDACAHMIAADDSRHGLIMDMIDDAGAFNRELLAMGRTAFVRRLFPAETFLYDVNPFDRRLIASAALLMRPCGCCEGVTRIIIYGPGPLPRTDAGALALVPWAEAHPYNPHEWGARK